MGEEKKPQQIQIISKKVMLSRTKLLNVLLEQVYPSFWGKTCFVWYFTSNLLHINRATLPFLIFYQLLEEFLHKPSNISHFTWKSVSLLSSCVLTPALLSSVGTSWIGKHHKNRRQTVQLLFDVFWQLVIFSITRKGKKAQKNLDAWNNLFYYFKTCL